MAELYQDKETEYRRITLRAMARHHAGGTQARSKVTGNELCGVGGSTLRSPTISLILRGRKRTGESSLGR